MRLTFVKLFPGTGNAAEKFFSLPRKGVKREARRICLASPKALWAKTVLSTELYHAPLRGSLACFQDVILFRLMLKGFYSDGENKKPEEP
jgi:hypothetical protein